MREMTRLEFEAYEKRVEAVLASVEQTLDRTEWAKFDKVAAAAREVVDIRREYLEFTERQADREGSKTSHGSRHDRYEDPNARWGAAVARFGLQAVETANEVLVEIDHYRERIDRIETGELPQSYAANYRAGLEREINRAAEMAVYGDNQYMREVAKSDHRLQREIERYEQVRAEDRYDDGGADRYRVSDPPGAGTNNQHERTLGGFQGTAEPEQLGDPDRGVQSTPKPETQVSEQQAKMPSQQHTRHPEERSDERRPAVDAGLARSDPPQQHVPRLRQIELELDERRDRDQDDRE